MLFEPTPPGVVVPGWQSIERDVDGCVTVQPTLPTPMGRFTVAALFLLFSRGVPT
jgi:hypothetical protein